MTQAVCHWSNYKGITECASRNEAERLDERLASRAFEASVKRNCIYRDYMVTE